MDPSSTSGDAAAVEHDRSGSPHLSLGGGAVFEAERTSTSSISVRDGDGDDTCTLFVLNVNVALATSSENRPIMDIFAPALR
jgi:hypothetical protein